MGLATSSKDKHTIWKEENWIMEDEKTVKPNSKWAWKLMWKFYLSKYSFFFSIIKPINIATLYVSVLHSVTYSITWYVSSEYLFSAS